MAYIYSCNARAYCLGDEIGYIKRGQFYPIEYVEKEFGEIIEKVIESRRATTVESVLRKSILIYMTEKQVNVIRVEKRHNKSVLAQSSFYQKWAEYVNSSSKFKANKLFALLAQQQNQAKVRQAKENKRIADMHVHYD